MYMRRLLTILLCLVLVSVAFAQEQSTAEQMIEQMAELNIQEPAVAEQMVLRNVQKVYDFNREFPQEKVFLQFDNTSYYQGETIWFKAFVVNASTLERSKSNVLYVELLSPTGVLLQQLKLKVYDGQGIHKIHVELQREHCVLKSPACIQEPCIRRQV